MLVSSPDGLVGKEEFEEIMSVRGRHVETSKEQVAIVVYNGHVAVEEVNEVVHKEAGKLDGDQIWAQLAWALFLVNFILWLCVQVILRKIRLSAVFFLFPGVFLMLSNGNRWHEQLSAYCVGGKVWKCVDYVEALFSPDFIVPTDEQFQHGGRSDRQEQAMELVQAMALVSWHVDRLQEHVERDMEARVVLSPWSEHKMWGGAEVEFIPAQERLCRMQKLRSSRATRGVALAHDQESGLGAQDEEELHVQQIKSRNVSILVTDMGKEASPCGTCQVGPDYDKGMGMGRKRLVWHK